MWLANFADGSSVSSRKAFWNQMPRTRKMTGLQLSHPYLPKLWLCLNGYDRYYFVTEAISTMGGSQTVNVIAEMIGAHDLKLGVAVEVRLARTGNVNVRTYPIPMFKYSPEILYDGNRNDKLIGFAVGGNSPATEQALST